MPDEAFRTPDVPVLPYASKDSVRLGGSFQIRSNLCITWSFVSLWLAYTYGVTYLDPFGCIGHAKFGLLLGAVPGLAFSSYLMLAAWSRRGDWELGRRVLLSMFAHTISLATPLLWDLREKWWPR